MTTKTKKEVDEHVRDILAKIGSEKEKSLRCFGIAKSYAGIGEIATAIRYVEIFIGSKPANVGEAYKLKGDLLVRTGELDEALDCYKSAYENGKSRTALSHVCDLLERGVGQEETNDSRKKWMDLKLSITNSTPVSQWAATNTNGVLTSASLTSLSVLTPRIRSPAPSTPGDNRFIPQQLNGTPHHQHSTNLTKLKSNSSPEENTYGDTTDVKSLYPSPERKEIQEVHQKVVDKHVEEKLDEILTQNTKLLERLNFALEEITELKGEVKVLKDSAASVAGKSGTHLTGTGLENSDGGAKLDKFLCKFGNDAKCKEFENMIGFLKPADSFAESNAIVDNQNDVYSTTFSEGSKSQQLVAQLPTVPAVISSTQNTPKPLSEVFKKAEGSWQCNSCYVSNKKDSPKCVACETPNPSAPAKAQPPNAAPLEHLPFTFSFKPVGFGDVAATSSGLPAGLFGSGFSKPFEGVGTPLFSSFNKPETNDTSTNEEEPEEFVPTAEFQPVIPLPPLVEVKKGDEDDTVMYESRVKLFRFEPATPEWKERGKGMIKIVQNKINPRQIRILMWRDQVLKLACNHLIKHDMSISYPQKSDTHLTWTGLDISDGEPKLEKFLCKFGNEEKCKEFKDQFENMVKFLKSVESNADSFSIVENQNDSNLSNVSEIAQSQPEKQVLKEPAVISPIQITSKPLSEVFKKAEGSWECNSCYVSNKKESPRCVACESPNPSAPPTATAQPPNAAPLEPLPFTFSFKPVGFGDVAPAASFSGLFGSGISKPFEGVGAPLFSSFNKPETNDTSTNEEEPEEFVPTAEFQPVIPLPPLVEVKKGDEDDTVMYESRVKLFRFEPATPEWKERGKGMIKIVQNKINPRQIRILMWRDQVLKLACNHLIKHDMSISYPQKSDTHLSWTALDISDGEAKLEKFLCKFGNEEKCKEFKDQFENMVKFLKSVESNADSFSVVENQNDSNLSNVSEIAQSQPEKQVLKEPAVISPIQLTSKPLSEVFKKAEGSWECNSCYVSNKKESPTCVACESPNPSAPAPATAQPPSTGPLPFTFSFKPVGFGDVAASSSGLFGSGISKPFEGVGTPLFSSFNKPETNDTSTNEEEPEEFVPTAEFQPVIPLPPLVEVKKGDEDDTVMYESRVKLFRFEPATPEWKERGKGIIKIVQNKTNPKQIRILMWRDQVLKLACNHLIKHDMSISYPQKSDVHLSWTGLDNSDGEAKLEKFLCKFGNEEKCAAFKKQFEDMVEYLKEVGTASPSDTKSSSSTLPNEESRSDLSTPPNQLSGSAESSPIKTTEVFEQISPGQDESSHHGCSGCQGCEPDDFDFNSLNKRLLPTYLEQTLNLAQLLESTK